MPFTHFSTVCDLLRYAVTRFNTENLFFGHGSSNAYDEAAYLILHTLKLPLHRLDTFLTARLMPDHFSPWVGDPESVTDVLELCTGSACLSIMLADVFPNAHIDAVDLSADALAVARRNVQEYAMQDRIALIQSDLYQHVPEQRYDLIVTNPPYVNAHSMNALPQEYRHET